MFSQVDERAMFATQIRSAMTSGNGRVTVEVTSAIRLDRVWQALRFGSRRDFLTGRP